MRPLKLTEDPHRRWNALTDEWVLVSPHRTQRPWQGRVEVRSPSDQQKYDPECYLCPGNARAGGTRNPAYTETFVFENDFAALKPDVPAERVDIEDTGLLVAEGEPGLCRVMCFSPRHDLTLSTMELPAIEGVIHTWAAQFRELGSMTAISNVQIFENRGPMMGASNPHPHCQIWATSSVPDAVVKERLTQRHYLQEHGKCLLCQYLSLEQKQNVRVICENDGFTALVPFWAVWPFEVLVCSRRHAANLLDLSVGEIQSLSALLKQVTSTYDKVFQVPFPYSMGLHQSPTDKSDHPEWHVHAHFYPPLLRSATVRKFMVGFEMFGMPQRDLTPELAADRLRSLSKAD